MARINVEFYDKKYTIEFDRESTKEFFKIRKDFNKETKDPLDKTRQLIDLIKCGLMKHHADDMPSDDEVFGWVLAMGEDAKPFMEALVDMINEIMQTVQTDRKNFHWGKAN